MEKLTQRQLTTYELIKKNSMNNDWTSKEEIIRNYPKELFKDGYIMNDTTHDICAAIWRDINAINQSYLIEKIIIADGKNNYKIAENKQEAEDYMLEFKNKAIKALIRYSNLKRKIRADGRGKLLPSINSPLEEENRAKDFVEAFLD